MKQSNSCLGCYGLQDGCDLCPAVLLCIDVSMAADSKHWDDMANRQIEIEEMENDKHWSQMV